jgi:hypothetical protein
MGKNFFKEEKFKNGLTEIEEIKLGKSKAEMRDGRKWDCERCKWERICLMEEKLKNGLIKTEDLKLNNKRLDEQLRVAAAVNKFVRHDRVQRYEEGEQCLVLGESIIRNV